MLYGGGMALTQTIAKAAVALTRMMSCSLSDCIVFQMTLEMSICRGLSFPKNARDMVTFEGATFAVYRSKRRSLPQLSSQCSDRGINRPGPSKSAMKTLSWMWGLESRGTLLLCAMCVCQLLRMISKQEIFAVECSGSQVCPKNFNHSQAKSSFAFIMVSTELLVWFYHLP